ncbi:hypothetical protein AAVH_37021, partial [Aphelenchoides avenae]
MVGERSMCDRRAITFEQPSKPKPAPGSPAGPKGPPASPKVACDKEWTYSAVTGKCYK